MRLITYTTGPSGTPRIGVRVGHRVLDIEAGSRVDGEPLPNSMKALLREGRGAFSRVQALAKAAQSNAGRYAGAMHEERAIRFLPPVPDAEKFLCVGERKASEQISGIVKPSSCLVGHNAKVAKPAGVAHLDFEPALVFVIGRRARGVGKDDDPIDYVAGVTLLNDLSDRDMREREIFGPLGPELVTLDEVGDLHDLWLTCSVNGEERLRANSGAGAWGIGEVLEHFSRSNPIEAGDMFSVAVAGAGSARQSLKAGDVVECTIEGVTTLRTTIVAA